MNLFKTSILNGIAVLIKTATMFLLNKILAVYVGPSGYAAIGQYQNFIQIITTFSGSAINTAVVKYTAEYYDDIHKQRAIWKTAGTLTFVFSVFFALLIIIFQEQLSIYIFNGVSYQSILFLFAIFLIFFNFNTLLLSILNGRKEIVKLVTANIWGSIFSLFVTSYLAYKNNLYGALLGLSIYQSMAFFITVILCLRSDWFSLKYLFGKINKEVAVKFSHYALMTLVVVVVGNFSQFVLRNYITVEFGLIYAGYWDAMNKLSSSYLMFITTLITMYYLPRISELKNNKDIVSEIYFGYKIFLILTSVICLFIYLFQELIVKLLFSEDFLPMLELLIWQLIGDILKIGSWLVSYVMLAKAMSKIFITLETIFLLSIIPITYVCVQIWGFKGVSIAFTINVLFYWVVASKVSFRKLKDI